MYEGVKKSKKIENICTLVAYSFQRNTHPGMAGLVWPTGAQQHNNISEEQQQQKQNINKNAAFQKNYLQRHNIKWQHNSNWFTPPPSAENTTAFRFS